MAKSMNRKLPFLGFANSLTHSRLCEGKTLAPPLPRGGCHDGCQANAPSWPLPPTFSIHPLLRSTMVMLSKSIFT